MAPFILNIDTRWRSVAGLTAQPRYPRRRW